MDSKQIDEHNRRQLAKLADYRHCFNTSHGTAVLKDLIYIHGIMRMSLSTTDPQKIAFNEGQRAVVSRILRLLEKDPKRQAEKLKEMSKNDKTTDDLFSPIG